MKNDGGKRCSAVIYDRCSPASASCGAAEGFPQSAINQITCRGPSAAAANDGDIDFIYLRKSIASSEGRDAVGEPDGPQNHGVCPQKRGGAKKKPSDGEFLASVCESIFNGAQAALARSLHMLNIQVTSRKKEVSSLATSKSYCRQQIYIWNKDGM